MTARVLRSLLLLACSLVGFGLFMIGIRVPFMFMLVAFGVAWNHTRRVVGSGWSHGTARIASLGVLVRHRMLGHDGLILGTTGIMPRPSLKEGLAGLWSSSNPAEMACYLFLSALGGLRWGGDRMIRINTFTHLATFAPTGRGKGVSVLVPNLLSYRHSCVVTDPKGELYLLTAKHRRQKFGHWTFRLDPFGICGPGSDRLNLLDWIDDKAADFLDQCRDFADMLVIRTGKEDDPHWNDSARMVLTAFIAYVCACEDKPEKRTLDTVRDLICSRHSYAKAVEIMQMVDSHWGVVQRQGHSLTWFVEKELGSVLTTVQRNTEFLDSHIITQNTSASSFNPRWLRTGNVTIYLCLPHDKLETLAPLMRAWIGVIIRTITRGTPTERNPVVFFLDEAAHLGKIRVLEQAVTLMRGMGVRLWFFFQSLHQLNDCFGEKAKTILDNIDTQQYFSINDYENAEAISKRIGDTTISISSHGGNSGRTRQTGGTGQDSGSVSTGENTNYSDTGRRLFKPEELLQLPEDVALIFHKNLPVITARLLRWYSHPAFRSGGTGGQAGLGRTATEKAVGLLLVSILFAAFAFGLSPVASTPHRTIRVQPHADRQYSPALSGR
jgi:type IV secretion system protein VirD4